MSVLTNSGSRRTRRAETLELPERVDWGQFGYTGQGENRRLVASGLGAGFIQAWGRPRGRVQPEHVSIYGPTGSGKSHFEKTILLMRAAARKSTTIIVATKPDDHTLTSMGWPVVDEWPAGYDKQQVIYWAKSRDLGEQGLAQQRKKVMSLLNRVWQPNSNIVLSFDELAYIEQDLGLRVPITRFYREGRALGITLVATTQRPSGVTRYMHSEAGWMVAFAPEDEDDRDRVAQILGNKGYYREVLSELDRERHEFLLIHKLTRESYISHLPKPGRRRK